MPDLMDFLLYCFYNNNFKADHLGRQEAPLPGCAMWESALLEYFRKTATKRAGSQQKLHPAVRASGNWLIWQSIMYPWATRPVKAGS